MLFSFIVTLREGFEVALVVAIVLGYLARTGNRQHFGAVWAGVGLAMAVTVAVLTALVVGLQELDDEAREAFEGFMMLAAVGVLTWMVFWMRRQAAILGADLRSHVDVALHRGSLWALSGLAFFAVVREGLETALFLFAGVTPDEGGSYGFAAGGVAGLAVAAVLGYAVYRGAYRLPIRQFFTVTGVAVLILGAGLLSSGLHELEEAALLPSLGARVWTTDGLLPEGGVAGAFLHTLVGYDSEPAWGQVIAYWLYLGVGLHWFVTGPRGSRATATTPARETSLGR